MLTFYIYRLVSDGKIAGPAIIVQCENDQEALESASRVLTAHGLGIGRNRPLAISKQATVFPDQLIG